MKTLFVGFKGKNNSSFLLLERLKVKEKLLIDNDKEKSCQQLRKKLEMLMPNVVIMFGQKPRLKNKLHLELLAKAEEDKVSNNCQNAEKQTLFNNKEPKKQEIASEEKKENQIQSYNEKTIGQVCTNFNYEELKNRLNGKGVMAELSSKAGNSYCNHIYYYSLAELAKEFKQTKFLFIHLPQMKNFENFEKVSALNWEELVSF